MGMNLMDLGWNQLWQQELDAVGQQYIPGRVCRVERGAVRVLTTMGEQAATLSGQLLHKIEDKANYPAVGDWVALEEKHKSFIIQAILPRRSCFTRKETISGGRKLRTINGRPRIVGGATEEQVIAANVDTVFLVSALDQNFTLRTIEVYLTVAIESGAKPVVVLNKADLSSNHPQKLLEVERLCPGTPVHVISAETGHGLESLSTYLTR